MTAQTVMTTLGDVPVGASFLLSSGSVCLRANPDVPGWTPPPGTVPYTVLESGLVRVDGTATPVFIVPYKAVPE